MVRYNIINVDVLVHIKMQIYEYAYYLPLPRPISTVCMGRHPS